MDAELTTTRGLIPPAASAEPDANTMDEADDQFDNEFILLVPDEFIGCILGRGGSTIRRLQWQTHTTIRVSNADEPFYPGTDYRLVTIISNSTAAMDAAQQLLLLQIAQNYAKTFREVSCVVPDDMAGRVIGKGGDRIQEIRNCCQNAELSNRGEGAQGERVMTIHGGVHQITKALRMVIDLVFHD
ncbi:hypothetical protein TrRE_jg13284 [Triparma retinervis]|uniref:K Homology domain-containing protein n=1 Tax=Triparma retinervis TaxID=2557542 RepID=A0A9W7E421_9STRA|nr:hypothetical protein TrRE_jg13284 [Triparma retinervis]